MVLMKKFMLVLMFIMVCYSKIFFLVVISLEEIVLYYVIILRIKKGMKV